MITLFIAILGGKIVNRNNTFHCSSHFFFCSNMPTPTWYRCPQWVIPQISLGVVECIVCFTCLCYSLYVYKTYIYRSNNSLSNSLKFMNLFGIIAFLCCGIVECINIYYWNQFYWKYSTIQTLTWYLTYFFWSLGQFMSYLLFLDRIKVSFEDSVYAPSKSTILFLYLLIMLHLLTWSIANFFPFTTLNDVDGNLDNNWLIEFYLSIPITILDIFITICMTYIFTSRLYRVMLIQTVAKTNDYKTRQNNALNTSLIITNQHTKMIKVSVKITILSVTSLISSLILITLRAITYHNKWGTPLDKIHTIWLQIDTIISCLCLVLFLPKTQKGFDLCCCCCNAILSKNIKKSLHRQTMYQLSSSN
eukprot:145357_1